MFVRTTQPVEIFGSVLRHFVPYPFADLRAKFFGDRPPGTPLSMVNARGVATYNDFGPVEGYILETVQHAASGTIND